MKISNRKAVIADPERPLVSVRVHNYNYGRYLRECLDSVLGQSYPNIEICISDNASSDESWSIVLEYQKKYQDIMNVACNRTNFGPDDNIANCIFPSRGKYTVQMCSDDTMAFDFVEKCVTVLEAHPNCAFVIVHRANMKENGELTYEPSFYNQNCLIKGEEQAAVYMMAAVNPSISQIMYVSNREGVSRVDFSRVLAGRWYGARIMDFNLCCRYPIAYIKEPLLNYRQHSSSDSQQVEVNLLEIIGPYILNHQFAEIARTYNLPKVVANLPKSITKLSQLCLRYCARFLILGNESVAEQYYHLAAALSLNIKSDDTFIRISRYWDADAENKAGIVKALAQEANLVSRKVSYDPPAGSVEIKIG